MYRLVEAKKGSKSEQKHDYTFKDFDSFYRIANILIVPFEGRYSIAINSSDVEQILNFIKIEEEYSHLMVFIYVPKEVLTFMTMRHSNLKVSGQVKPIEEFKTVVNKHSILFKKGVDYILFNSIEHTIESYEEALTTIKQEYGSHVEITEQMLSKIFNLNKLVYPRSVLIDYLWLRRYRVFKLNKCIESMGNDICLFACINNVEDFMKQKIRYYTTGLGSDFIKTIDIHRLELMYRVLVVERNGIKDMKLLMELYERGLSADDFIQERFN